MPDRVMAYDSKAPRAVKKEEEEKKKSQWILFSKSQIQKLIKDEMLVQRERV